MELPRIVHDELLHKVDEPHDQHLADVRHAAEVIVPADAAAVAAQRGASSERSPLLKPTPSGNHIVVVDVDKVEAILDAEERAAIAADAKLPTWTIVGEESVKLLKLAVPMVRRRRHAHV